MIKIAFAKGNIQKKACNILWKKWGVDFNKNKLSIEIEGNKYFFVKHRDIPKLLMDGVVDIGVTSFEWIKEKKVDVHILKTLDWCDTTICYIEPVSRTRKDNVTCVTEFPNIASEYFKNNGMDVDIKLISGSSEAYVPWLYDSCVDCVETGLTLLENNLRVKDIIISSKIVVCVRKTEAGLYEEFIEELFNDECES